MLAGSIITKYYFDIPMENVQSVQLSQSLYYLNKDAPNLLLANVSPLLLVFNDLVTEIALACVLHNDAALVSRVP
jgi:hypothetical protein